MGTKIVKFCITQISSVSPIIKKSRTKQLWSKRGSTFEHEVNAQMSKGKKQGKKSRERHIEMRGEKTKLKNVV